MQCAAFEVASREETALGSRLSTLAWSTRLYGVQSLSVFCNTDSNFSRKYRVCNILRRLNALFSPTFWAEKLGFWRSANFSCGRTFRKSYLIRHLIFFYRDQNIRVTKDLSTNGCAGRSAIWLCDIFYSTLFCLFKQTRKKRKQFLILFYK